MGEMGEGGIAIELRAIRFAALAGWLLFFARSRSAPTDRSHARVSSGATASGERFQERPHPVGERELVSSKGIPFCAASLRLRQPERERVSASSEVHTVVAGAPPASPSPHSVSPSPSPPPRTYGSARGPKLLEGSA
jgi:hypothetical protein